MTNQDQPDLPKNEGDAGSDELAELDVDALLDQASSLADEISSEVGESADEQDGSAQDDEAAVGSAPEAESTDVEANADQGQAEAGADDLPTPTDQVEHELDDLQAVVDSLGVEMSDASDDEEGRDDEGEEETGDLASADEGAADQGDPGSDSGEAGVGEGSPADPPPVAEFDLAAAASDLGLDTTDSTKPVGESPGITELSAEELAFDAPTGSGSLDEPGDEPAQASGGRLIGRLAPLLPVLRKAEPIALRVAGIVAFVIEKLDRPFGMIGHKIRSILGLLAIATMATAIVVLAVSFL